MRFAEDVKRFMRPDGDRLVALAGLLAARALRYSVVKTGDARHVMVRVGRSKPRLAFVAHYDRFAGSPGTLDNSCACLQLAEFAARKSVVLDRTGPKGAPPSFLVAFTDAEEAPVSSKPFTQGSYALARKLKAAAGAGDALAAIVLDVTGRGDRLLLSKAPAELLARRGLSLSPAAVGHRSLVSLAKRAALRAGLAEPLEAGLPWSDDLGLTLGGLPALTISLLPAPEAAMLAAGKRPPLWGLLHTEADSPELAQKGAFDLMSAFLDALVVELARPPEGSLY
ncbi:MAG: M28 family peptidase [Rectinemataceae bacterium]|jgi:hypothetical protein